MQEHKLKGLNYFTLVMDFLFNSWAIILCCLTVYLSVNTYYGYIYEPKYTSSMTVAVNSRDSNGNIANNLSTTVEIAQVFKQLFESNVMRVKIVEELGYFPDGNIVVTQLTETNLLQLSVTDRDPMRAYETLKAVFANHTTFAEFTFDNIILNVLSFPSVPTYPSNPVSGRARAVKLAFFVGVILSGLVLIMSYLRDTVKSKDDAEDMLAAPMFGVIYHERLRSGGLRRRDKVFERLTLTNPLINYSFSESFRKMSVKLDFLRKSKQKNVVMITSVDEHEGKTTVSVNMAMSLASMGHKVVLVDADLRKPSTRKHFPEMLRPEEESLGDLLVGKADINSVIRYDKESSLYLLLNNKPFRNSSEVLSQPVFKKLISELSEQFDFVIIDTPPVSLVADAETISPVASETLLVVHQDASFVGEINDVIETLNAAGTEVIGCVVNDVRTIEGLLFGRYRIGDSIGMGPVRGGYGHKQGYGYGYGYDSYYRKKSSKR